MLVSSGSVCNAAACTSPPSAKTVPREPVLKPSHCLGILCEDPLGWSCWRTLNNLSVREFRVLQKMLGEECGGYLQSRIQLDRVKSQRKMCRRVGGKEKEAWIK